MSFALLSGSSVLLAPCAPKVARLIGTPTKYRNFQLSQGEPGPLQSIDDERLIEPCVAAWFQPLGERDGRRASWQAPDDHSISSSLGRCGETMHGTAIALVVNRWFLYRPAKHA